MLPQEYKDYQWIADRFAAINGVEMILINTQAQGSEVNLMITNNAPGDSNKTFVFPLRTLFYLDYATAPEDCPNDWDINSFSDSDLIVNMAEAKAKVIFEDVRCN